MVAMQSIYWAHGCVLALGNLLENSCRRSPAESGCIMDNEPSSDDAGHRQHAIPDGAAAVGKNDSYLHFNDFVF